MRGMYCDDKLREIDLTMESVTILEIFCKNSSLRDVNKYNNFITIKKYC